MRRILLVCCAVVVAAACGQAATTTGTGEPQWLADSIQRIRSEPVRNPPAVISRYEFKDGLIAYGVSSPCCDFYNYLLDERGNAICAPSGGIAGRGDGKCPPALLEDPRKTTVVWRDDRTK